MPEHQQTQQSKESKTTSQKQATPISQTPVSHPISIIQRARINPKSLTHADVMQLQRTIGNRAVGRLFSEIGLIPSTAKPVQRQGIPDEEKTCPSCMQRQEIPEEEEPLQGKLIEPIQRQEIPEEEEPLQGKFENKPEIACPSCFAAPIVQRQEIPEEEEPLQGKFESIQRQEIPEEKEPLQPKRENNTRMPDNLKAGVESLSGIDMSYVKVHYNSSKPAEVGALAYTQGTNIHVAPGQERHLPHETWHVVQQAQGRKPTMQVKGVSINDDTALESEADVMGAKALQMTRSDQVTMLSMSLMRRKKAESPLHAQNLLYSANQQTEQEPVESPATDGSPVQLRKVGKFGVEAEVLKERFKMIALKEERSEADILADPEIVLEEFSLGTLGNEIDVTLDNELTHETDITKERSFTVEFASKAVDVVEGDPHELEKMEQAWTRAGQFWRTNLLGARKVIGMVGEAADWFTQNPHWEAPQFDKYRGKRNVDQGADNQRLYWDGPGFFTYIDAQTEDPPVSMQATTGSTLLSLDAVNFATSHVLALDTAPSKDQLRRYKESRDLGYEETQLEAWALLKILRDYKNQSFNALLDHIKPGGLRPKRYQKEYISLMVRTSLSSVFDGMSEEGRTAFIQWVRAYGEGNNGPIALELGSNPQDAFFVAPTTKEPQANTISVANVLVSIINCHLPEKDRDEVKPGDAFSQVTKDNELAPLAGFGEISEDRQDQLDKYGLNHANEMMRGVTGLIAENRAAKIQPLSKIPEVFRQLVAALKAVEDG